MRILLNQLNVTDWEVCMPYDDHFYKLYREYLREHSVRKSHDFAFAQFERMAGAAAVIDLGCGLGEFAAYGHFRKYAGIDVNWTTAALPQFIQDDYHDLSFADQLDFAPNTFLSLFSIECFHGPKEKYEFYGKIFREIPSIQYGLVSGFVYESKRDQAAVEENGKILSYQTIEDPSQYVCDEFAEQRMHLRTPSAMFGEDVIEVWKFLVRR